MHKFIDFLDAVLTFIFDVWYNYFVEVVSRSFGGIFTLEIIGHEGSGWGKYWLPVIVCWFKKHYMFQLDLFIYTGRYSVCLFLVPIHTASCIP